MKAPQASEARDVQYIVEVKVDEYQARMQVYPAAIFLNLADRERLNDQYSLAGKLSRFEGIPVIMVPTITEPMVGG